MLGSIYRSINTSLVDTERLLKLLDEPTEVIDKPNAEELSVTDGEITFGNCSKANESIDVDTDPRHFRKRILQL
jgi:ABC-type transport system involved in Fe-S cluster assembly fused permease/ATPase subunit